MRAEAVDFLRWLETERNDSPNTVKAYGRDLAAFEAFLDGYYGGGTWTWAGVDRLAVRGFLGEGTRRGWSKRTMARALSALRTYYRFLNLHHGVEVNPARAASTPKPERKLPGYLNRGAMDRLFTLAETRARDGAFRFTRSRTGRSSCGSRPKFAFVGWKSPGSASRRYARSAPSIVVGAGISGSSPRSTRARLSPARRPVPSDSV